MDCFLKKMLLLIHIRSRVKLIGVHMEIVYVLTTKIGSRLDQSVWSVAPGSLTGVWRCNWSGRSWPVWPLGQTGPNRIRVQLEIFIDLDLVIGFLVGQVHPPYKYKGPRPIEASNRSKHKTNLLFHCLYFYLSILIFSTPLSSVLPSSLRRLKTF